MAAGTACSNGTIVAATDPSCIAAPSATPSPGSSPSPTPAPPGACLGLDDGLYCSPDAAEAAARANASASGAFISPCLAHFVQCYAGTAAPVRPVAPGTLCLDGALVFASEARCAAPSAAKNSACLGDDGLYCAAASNGTECSQAWYQCVGGQPTVSQSVAAGTACYGNASAPGQIVAAGYGACIPAGTAARCDPAVDEIVCSDPVAPASRCGTALHRCYFGTASASWAVPAGTLCLDGSLVFDNNPACNVTVPPAAAAANVTLDVNASGLTGEAQR